MKRTDLEIGARYVGPEGRCYEIVETTPGWRVSGSGDWVEDSSTRTRHMPGKGETAYRSNLAVKVYLVQDDGELKPSAIDPRRLTGPWSDYEAMKTSQDAERIHTNRLVTLLRRNLRGQQGHMPSPVDAYSVSADGSSVTLPMKDLSMLMGIAFGDE